MSKTTEQTLTYIFKVFKQRFEFYFPQLTYTDRGVRSVPRCDMGFRSLSTEKMKA